jgi:hypothetical protein
MCDVAPGQIPNIDDGCMDVNCEWSVTRATLSMMSIDESYTDGAASACIGPSGFRISPPLAANSET